MAKFNTSNLKIYFLILTASASLYFIGTNLKIARAENPLWPPVPNYGSITTGETTSVTVTEGQLNSWRGNYARTQQTDFVFKTPSLEKLFNTVFWNQRQAAENISYQYNPRAIYEWVGSISQNISSQTANPQLTIKNNRAVSFTPPQNGQTLDKIESVNKIITSLEQGQKTILLPIKSTLPEVKLASLNKLGIKQLIGRGESKFSGSPANRIHNINKGIEKMRGIIVSPGEEFSFNKYLGPVDGTTGFLPELVIKKDGTVPEFGGGLCQVSSTAWRAAMHAGMPITQRKNHSYAVQYYAPQGTDATIYPGVIDMKFKNDTGASILIWPYLKEKNHLVFDFYGSYDGRKVTLGTPKQFDKKSDGSMKASWSRKVSKNGQIVIDEVFNSVYLPPALFHKQETFVSNSANTPSPSPNPSISPSPSPSLSQPIQTPQQNPSPSILPEE